MVIDFTTNVGMLKKGNYDIGFENYVIYVRFLWQLYHNQMVLKENTGRKCLKKRPKK